MLQQTQVARVIDRLPPFLRRFPTPSVCAAAAAGDVVDAWAGLGYNRRALHLHRAATVVTLHHDGRIPERLEDLLALPGVGPYTARAVRAFAFEHPAAVVDTNVGRVLARWGGRPLTGKEAQQRADALAVETEVWLWNQSIMEFGACVCTKRSPDCERCPLRSFCHWRGDGNDPAIGSAGVSSPQARFDGSDRQFRGRLVSAMRRGPIARCDVAEIIGTDEERVVTVIAGLERDGLVVVDGESLRLP